MFYYARSDTHYLLYIFDMVRNELVENSDRQKPEHDYIEQVVQKSKEVSLFTHQNPYANPENGLGPRGWYGALTKVATLFDSEQFSVYKAVHQWRDELARREDESPFFFMSQQVLADIARVMPSDKKALWSLLDSNARGLKVHLDDLFDVIQAAKAAGINGPTMADVLRASYGEPTRSNATVKANTSAVTLDLETLDIQDLKSQRSQLWGDVAMSSTWEDASAKGAKLDDRVEIVVPYPFVQDAADAESSVEQEPAKPIDQPVEAQGAAIGNEEFTLKGGRKRKLEDVNVESEDEDEDASGPADNADTHMAVDSPEAGGESGDEDGEESKAEQEKAAKKAAKRARKKVKKEKMRLQQETEALEIEAKKAKKAAERLEKQQQKEADVEAEEEEEPFDYSKAEPVLNAKNGGASRGRENRRGKVFNPYGKGTGDAPKSARATNHVKNGGRSATFKK